jgi:hypothetical protein
MCSDTITKPLSNRSAPGLSRRRVALSGAKAAAVLDSLKDLMKAGTPRAPPGFRLRVTGRTRTPGGPAEIRGGNGTAGSMLTRNGLGVGIRRRSRGSSSTICRATIPIHGGRSRRCASAARRSTSPARTSERVLCAPLARAATVTGATAAVTSGIAQRYPYKLVGGDDKLVGGDGLEPPTLSV